MESMRVMFELHPKMLNLFFNLQVGVLGCYIVVPEQVGQFGQVV